MKPRLYAATITPLTGSGSCDVATLIAHCQNLLARGCDGIALFGTTGEGPSFSVGERQAALDALLEGGVDPAQLIIGIGCANLPDAVDLARHAAVRGCESLLFAPPFYFKDVDDAGLFDAFSLLLDAVEETAVRIVAYHIPPVTGIGLSPPLIQRLRARYGARIAAVKDSSGDWNDTAALLQECAGLPVFVGHEPDLSRALDAGAAGTISGLANLAPDLLRSLLDDPLPQRQASVNRLASAFDELPFVAAMKAALAHEAGARITDAVRPPLRALTICERRALFGALRHVP